MIKYILVFVLGVMVGVANPIILIITDKIFRWNRKKYTYKIYCYLKHRKDFKNITTLYRAGYISERQLRKSAKLNNIEDEKVEEIIIKKNEVSKRIDKMMKEGRL